MAAISLPDPPLREGDLVLREFSSRDAPRIVHACSAPSTRRFLPDLPDPYTEGAALEWVQSHPTARMRGDRLTLALARVEDDRLLGALTAEIHHGQERAELGYWLVPDARGRGYMTSAVRLMSAWLFGTLRLGRLQILTEPSNLASGAIARRCGYQQEGLLRAYLRDRNGTRRDSLIWGLLPGELVWTRDLR